MHYAVLTPPTSQQRNDVSGLATRSGGASLTHRIASHRIAKYWGTTKKIDREGREINQQPLSRGFANRDPRCTVLFEVLIASYDTPTSSDLDDRDLPSRPSRPSCPSQPALPAPLTADLRPPPAHRDEPPGAKSVTSPVRLFRAILRSVTYLPTPGLSFCTVPR